MHPPSVWNVLCSDLEVELLTPLCASHFHLLELATTLHLCPPISPMKANFGDLKPRSLSLGQIDDSGLEGRLQINCLLYPFLFPYLRKASLSFLIEPAPPNLWFHRPISMGFQTKPHPSFQQPSRPFLGLSSYPGLFFLHISQFTRPRCFGATRSYSHGWFEAQFCYPNMAQPF